MAKNLTKLTHRFPLRQLKKLPTLFRSHWPVLLLPLFSLVLAYLNYSPNTFLSGWDNLHPEFAPLLNLRRAFFAVWQEYQSFGLLGGMAHAADLPRTLLVYALSLTPLPLSFFRYGWTFLSLFAGPLGVYFFLDSYLLRHKFASNTTKIAGFLGGLFYLLNLSTVQVFFTPFETFTAFYGFFPWLIFFTLKHLSHPNFKNTLILFLLSFFASPSFYVETLFIVYLLCLLPFFLEFIFSHRHKLPEIKSSLHTLFVSLTPHLYWLLPVIFFVLTNGSVGQNAKINTIATPEVFARNLQFGTLDNLALLKGFWFNYVDSTGGGQYDFLLRVWRQHTTTFTVSLLSYTLFTIILIGLYFSFKKKLPLTLSLTGVLFLCYFFLLGGSVFFTTNLPLIGELFRSPFTKFSIPLSFVYASFFAVGSIFLLDLFTFLDARLTNFFTSFTLTLFLIITTSPAFAGQLISPTMRVNLPIEYTELFSYLKTIPQTDRILNLPLTDFWGWYYYDFGYRGSGFLWYGVPQPMVDRTFDVWDRTSEKSYEALNAALYSQNFTEFDRLLDLYHLPLLLLDTHQIPANPKIDNFQTVLLDHLNQNPDFTLEKSFQDRLFLYRRQTVSSGLLDLGQPTPPTYPYHSLSLRPTADINLTEDSVHFPSINLNTPNQTLNLPSLTDTEALLPVQVSYQKDAANLTLKITPLTPQIKLDDQDLSPTVEPTLVKLPLTGTTESLIVQIDSQFYELQIPAEVSTFDYFPLVTLYLPTKQDFDLKVYDGSLESDLDLTDTLSQLDPYQCYTEKSNRHIEKILTQNTITLIGTDVVGCLSAPLPLFPSDGVISYSFSYSSSTSTPGSVSITDLNLGSLNQTELLRPQATSTRTRQFSPVSSKPQKLNLLLEANETKTPQEINYQHIKANFHPLLFATSTSLNPIYPLTTTISSASATLSLSTPLIDSSYDSLQTPSSNQLFPESRNCDQFNTGLFTKKVTSDQFNYFSQNANSCDYLDLRQLPHSLNYLLTFSYDHLSGLPTTVCLENHATNRCDVFERLRPDLSTQSLLNPISNSSQTPGYTLHLFNQSYGQKSTLNSFTSFSLHPVPLRFLNAISLSTPDQLISDENKLDLINHQEFFSSLNLSAKNDTTLSFYQTRSPFWQAIIVSNNDLSSPFFLTLLKLPYLYFTQPHLEKSSSTTWFNQWSMPKGDRALYLVYLPQYLEFIGLFIFVLSVTVYLLTFFLSPRSKTKKS